MNCADSTLPGSCICYRHRRARRGKAELWRIAARVYRQSGRMDEYRAAARTAAIIEGRPWKVDRGNNC